MARTPALPDLSGLTDEQHRRRDEVIRFGELAYGSMWKTDLARTLGRIRGRDVAEEQIHAWVRGRRPVPEAVIEELLSVSIQTSLDLHDRAECLQAWPGKPARKESTFAEVLAGLPPYDPGDPMDEVGDA